MNRNIAVLLLLNIVCMANSANILLVFPTPAPSHFFLGSTLAKGLADAGHQVTMVSAFDDTSGKYETVLLDGIGYVLMNSNLSSWAEMGKKSVIEVELESVKISHILTNATLAHPNFQKLLNSRRKFDVIILEMFLNDALKVLSCHFDAPLISFVTFGHSLWSSDQAGSPFPPSYIPDVMSSSIVPMNLWQRTINSIKALIRTINKNFNSLPVQGKLVQKYFPECHDRFNEHFYNVSLTLVNSHESVNYPTPSVPSLVQIGGYHIKPAKKLPDDLQKFMDEAKDGVVYFSLGTNIDSSFVNPETKNALMAAFSKLKQKVLVKGGSNFEESAPDNVLVRQFFPQQDILAHPNLKLFITHGGLLSIFETVYHGVPVLCLPAYGDQLMNAAKIENDGYGLSILLNDLNEKSLNEALDKLLNDPRYMENVKERSELMRDRPVKPMDLAIYWIEYVIKHKGAPHLRVGALDLTWYQYFLVDVAGLVIIILLVVFASIYYALRTLLRLFVKNKKYKSA
ncbi:unnamed protein product [Phyllotreta striolata]|uniref:UDP-glucuronosyltransferase n=1 Tax=Phyllotreta striolata TaxID=444603 RepID=A0A9N9XMA5_PHYSR|nr:unnamed protein product [Phyllotreta striolata]